MGQPALPRIRCFRSLITRLLWCSSLVSTASAIWCYVGRNSNYQKVDCSRPDLFPDVNSLCIKIPSDPHGDTVRACFPNPHDGHAPGCYANQHHQNVPVDWMCKCGESLCNAAVAINSTNLGLFALAFVIYRYMSSGI